jgi:hypothetical protein
LIGQLTRFREDDRFRSVGPDHIVLSSPHSVGTVAGPGDAVRSDEAEVGLTGHLWISGNQTTVGTPVFLPSSSRYNISFFSFCSARPGLCHADSREMQLSVCAVSFLPIV